MSDFGVQEYGEAFAALSAQTSALSRYGAIVSEQYAAAAADDLDRVAALAEDLDQVIGELEVSGRRLTGFQQRVQRGEVGGPRASALKREMLALAESAAAIEQLARGLIRQLSSRRNAVGVELAELELQRRAASRYDAPSGLSSPLVDATA